MKINSFFLKLQQWARILKSQIITLWFCYRNKKTPRIVKFLCILIVSYALSPIDLIPDFIPVLGYLDDLLLLPIAIWWILKWIPPEILESSKLQAQRWIDENHSKPKNLWAAAVILGIWLATIILLITISWDLFKSMVN